MEIKQVITADYAGLWVGYSTLLEFTDPNGNQINIRINESDFLELASLLHRRAEQIREEIASKSV